MTEQRVSFRYARAVIETAVQENIADVLLKDFIYITEVCNVSHELRTFIISPLIHERDKLKVTEELFKDKVSDLTLTFMNFLIKKGRSNLILDIIAQYEEQYNQINNRIKARITTAIELNEEANEMITKAIGDYTKKTILAEFIVDKGIQGGILVRIEDWVYDASLKRQLESLYNRLSNN